MSIQFTSPEDYTLQLDDKIELLYQQLRGIDSQINHDDIAVFTSPVEYYRQRAEFKLWHEGDVAHYAMTDPQTKKPVFIDHFPVASVEINRLMPLLLEAINQNEMLRKKCFQVEFLSTLNNETLITLIYHKALGDDWVSTIEPLAKSLNVDIIGRSRKQKIVLQRDFVIEKLSVNGKVFTYKQIEGSFTQPNAKVCEKMLSWAVQHSQNIGNDLLELYCGNGNFTLPLSQQYRRVVATEISKTSINAALDNVTMNNIDNVDLVRMSSEEFVQAMDKVRSFRRLEKVDLDAYRFSTVFVDPPRAGLDEQTVKMIQRFDNIIYISCNPATLVENLCELNKTHRINALAAFDQFPYTDHLESGVILERRS